MGTFTIIDKAGKWVVNPHAFRFVDPETGTVFAPQHAVKVKVDKDSWLAGQMAAKVIVDTEDPTHVPAPPKAAAPPSGKPAGPG